MLIICIAFLCFHSDRRYSFPFGRPEGALKATLSLFERVRQNYLKFLSLFNKSRAVFYGLYS